jgi:cytochrome bd ubiquinol oxidase subunit I
MSTLDLARLQFALTSVYHFLFVPVTIGLALLTAVLQTWWHRTGDAGLLRLTRFFGAVLVINIAVGVVTGLVQEFQFGMNWSEYTRTVGEIFGAPLAMEGLAAFFLEAVLLGMWVFGWNRLSPRVHLLTIWGVGIGASLSAAFIIAANSWMQHPVGYSINPATGRPQLDDLGAVFTNPVFVWGYIHALLASLVTGSVVMLAIAAWQMRRGREPELFRAAARVALRVLAPSVLLAMMVGSHLGVVEAVYQPMKIAASEAQWETCAPCSFSLFQIGGGNNDQTPIKVIQIPHLLSLLATGTWDGQVLGLNPLQAQYTQQYGPGYYIPNVFVQYWSMRVMAYTAAIVLLVAVWGLWALRRKRLVTPHWFLRVAVWIIPLPFVMNTAGWFLTEIGRQPWVVQGVLLTRDGVTPPLSTFAVGTSLVTFALLYLVLAVVYLVLVLRVVRRGPDPVPVEPGERDDLEPALGY